MIKKLKYVFALKCPKCREGELFVIRNPYLLKKLNVMHKNCNVCGLKYSREPGFFFGAAYVSYALQVLLAIATYFSLSLLSKLSVNWIFVLTALVMILATPYITVLSRSFWIFFFVSYDPNNRRVK
ncbi:MAG: DUF983 domain-containing protein [Crocinitomicaceae bacterium]|nr:DUF983 domain-containing protein [Crocinitomicaceae bacterium]|tara:strand:+ start:6531 stop:6908 length:378 start_codon:yes stop_codon:yes gene_type:complete